MQGPALTEEGLVDHGFVPSDRAHARERIGGPSGGFPRLGERFALGDLMVKAGPGDRKLDRGDAYATGQDRRRVSGDLGRPDTAPAGEQTGIINAGRGQGQAQTDRREGKDAPCRPKRSKSSTFHRGSIQGGRRRSGGVRGAEASPEVMRIISSSPPTITVPSPAPGLCPAGVGGDVSCCCSRC